MKKGVFIPLIIVGSLLITMAGVVAIGSILSGDNKEVTHEYEVDAFTNVSMDIHTANIEFKVAEDDKYKVVCNETEKHYHEVKVEENTLKVNAIDNTKWYEQIFNFNIFKMSVIVYVPNTELNTVDIDISTGNVVVPEQFILANLKVEGSTGDINLKAPVTEKVEIVLSTGNANIETTTKNMEVETSTGQINIKNSNVAETMHLKASTGKISLEDSHAKNLNLVTSTGDMYLSNVIIEEHIEAEASTGGIKFVDSDAATITIKTTTGDVDLVLLSGKIYSISSTTGHVSYPDPDPAGGLCKVTTTTGHINISIKAA